ncbi:hypothetical protein [Roseateles sp. LYH14W]|uniref:DUF2244 domain-containing protein n=1 Tax=Pelomonas parva TaxID=3299032 RepID=A0ABW7F4L1_9BURK
MRRPPRKPAGFNAASHERHHWWRSLLLKLALGGVSVAVLWWVIGGIAGLLLGLLIAARALGPALAPDLLALAGTAWRGLRHLAFRSVEGRYYQFKGHRIRVEDDELLPRRWLALQDLSTALGAPIPAAVLERRGPEALFEQRDGLYVRDEVVLMWLREQRDDRAGRLAHWIEREVWLPARGRKGNYQT